MGWRLLLGRGRRCICLLGKLLASLLRGGLLHNRECSFVTPCLDMK